MRVDAPRPWEIIAITFTNKAAGELKERLAARLGPAANDVWASTFHSACVRILRRDIDRIGFDKDFTIYDTDDAKRVIKDILKEQNLDEKTFPARERSVRHQRLQGPLRGAGGIPPRQAEAANDWKNDPDRQDLRRLSAKAAARPTRWTLMTSSSTPSRCCKRNREVLDYYQKKFRYVLVDEYQDTNHLQYLLTSLLAGRTPEPLRGGR